MDLEIVVQFPPFRDCTKPASAAWHDQDAEHGEDDEVCKADPLRHSVFYEVLSATCINAAQHAQTFQQESILTHIILTRHPVAHV